MKFRLFFLILFISKISYSQSEKLESKTISQKIGYVFTDYYFNQSIKDLKKSDSSIYFDENVGKYFTMKELKIGKTETILANTTFEFDNNKLKKLQILVRFEYLKNDTLMNRKIKQLDNFFQSDTLKKKDITINYKENEVLIEYQW